MVIYSQLVIAGSNAEETKSITINKSVGDSDISSSFSATIDNYNGDNSDKYTIGQTIEVYADKDINPPTTRIFNGILEDVNFPGGILKETMQLGGRDYTARLMDRIVEPEVYTNLLAGSIVKDLINKYVDDITTGSFVNDTATTISRIAFSNTSVFDAVKKLNSMVAIDNTFYVDPNKNLHFEPKSQTSSGYTLGSHNVSKCNVKENRDTVFNEVWIYGDKYLDNFDESFIADGGSTFTLLYKPHNTKVLVSGAQQQGAIAEMNNVPISGTDYLISFNDKTITFISGTDIGYNAIPGSKVAVSVNYDRDLPVIRMGQNGGSISTYGKRCKIIVDKDLKDPDTAQLILEKKLESLGTPKRDGTIAIKGLLDIEPSETIVVNLPTQNMDNQVYDVLQVSYNFNQDNNYSEKVQSFRVNKKIDDVTDRIKNMEERIKKLEGADTMDADILPRFEFTTGSLSVRQSGCILYTATLTFSGLCCAWQGCNLTLVGALASGTNQKSLYGVGMGSAIGEYQIAWSGGYP